MKAYLVDLFALVRHFDNVSSFSLEGEHLQSQLLMSEEQNYVSGMIGFLQIC